MFAPFKPLYLFLLLLLLFRHLKITLDSEEPSQSKNGSLRQSEVEYDVSEHFQRGLYSSDNCAFDL